MNLNLNLKLYYFIKMLKYNTKGTEIYNNIISPEQCSILGNNKNIISLPVENHDLRLL